MNKTILSGVLSIAIATTSCAGFANDIATVTSGINTVVPTSGDHVTQFSVKDYIGAIAISNVKMKRSRTDAMPVAINGWSHLSIDNIDTAEKRFQRVMRLDRTNIHGPLGMVWVNIKRNDLEEAQQWLDKAHPLQDQVMESTWESAAGWLSFFKGDLNKAEQHFKKSKAALFFDDAEYIQIQTEVMAAWEAGPRVGLGWVYFTRGEPDAATQSFEDGLIYDKTCHLCYDGLAQMALARGDRLEAIRLAAKGLSVSRYDPKLLEFLNTQLTYQANPELSRAVFEKIAKAARQPSAYMANLGFTRFWLGDYAGAESAFTKAGKGKSGAALAKTGLARVACVNERNENWYDCMEREGVPAR